MVCIAAIILIAEKNPAQLNRLVFAVNDYSYPNYGVFKVPADGQFPAPRDDSVTMTNTKVDGIGTYVQLYCSHRWHDYNMIGKISDELVDITEDAVHRFETPINTARYCCEEIVENRANPRGYRKLWHTRPRQRWSEHKYKYCTPKVLANLAFQGQVQIEGNLENFVPPGRTSKPEIMFDKKITLAQIIYMEQTFKDTKSGKQPKALAWYQGHLHMFQMSSNGDWMPHTRIGIERINGNLIFKHLHKNIPLFSETEEYLVNYLKRTRGEYLNRNPSAEESEFHDYVDTQKNLLQTKLKDKDLGSLRPTYDGAFISGIKLKKDASKGAKLRFVSEIKLYAPRSNYLHRL